jgi:hypothetical protein
MVAAKLRCHSLCSKKRVIVVEAAGNGGENLDDPLYDTPPEGFPSGWKNPFNPANPSSGAIIVGAGNPPAGTHGKHNNNDGEPYKIEHVAVFSNYGSRIDRSRIGVGGNFDRL